MYIVTQYFWYGGFCNTKKVTCTKVIKVLNFLNSGNSPSMWIRLWQLVQNFVPLKGICCAIGGWRLIFMPEVSPCWWVIFAAHVVWVEGENLMVW